MQTRAAIEQYLISPHLSSIVSTYICPADATFRVAVQSGYYELVQNRIAGGAPDWKGGMHDACMFGYPRILELMINGVKPGVGPIANASLTFLVGCLMAVGAAIDAAVARWDIVPAAAPAPAPVSDPVIWKKGIMSLISSDSPADRLLVANAPPDWNQYLRIACRGGHLECAAIMVRQGANDWDGALQEARQNGHYMVAFYIAARGSV